MTKEELIKTLEECKLYADYDDEEEAHKSADDLLLHYINDPEITELFNSIKKIVLLGGSHEKGFRNV